MEIKDIIRNRRKELKLTMLDVAKACEVSEATVSRWESGDIGDMKRSRISSLARILRISPNVIVGDQDDVNTDRYGLNKDTMFDKLTHNNDLLEIYHEITNSDTLKLLFDKAKNLDEDEMIAVLNIINAIKKEN